MTKIDTMDVISCMKEGNHSYIIHIYSFNQINTLSLALLLSSSFELNERIENLVNLKDIEEKRKRMNPHFITPSIKQYPVKSNLLSLRTNEQQLNHQLHAQQHHSTTSSSTYASNSSYPSLYIHHPIHEESSSSLSIGSIRREEVEVVNHGKRVNRVSHKESEVHLYRLNNGIPIQLKHTTLDTRQCIIRLNARGGKLQSIISH